MTYSTLIAAATLAALPVAAIADNHFSPFVKIFAGEQGYLFADPPSTLTRAEVQVRLAANLDQVRASLGEGGYTFIVAPSTRSRAEVLAELREAQRLGLIANGEAGPPIATPHQEALIARAGEAAANLQARAGSAAGG